MIQIRRLLTFDEMAEAVQLQKIYWGHDGQSLVQGHMLYTIATNGGHVLAAMDGSRMVGLLIGLIGTDMSEPDRPAMTNLLIASKRMVVLPEYRGQGIGYDLKLKQRELAIKQGIRLVTWTFDPLLSANAYLNLRKLGGISQKYLQNYYGTNPVNALVSLGTSDRLAVDWWVTSHRVEEKVNGIRTALTLEHYLDAAATFVNFAYDETPNEDLHIPNGAFALLEIPANYTEMLNHDTALAQLWREHTRLAFQRLMRQGYIVTDFLHEQYQGRLRSFYVLSLAVDEG